MSTTKQQIDRRALLTGATVTTAAVAVATLSAFTSASAQAAPAIPVVPPTPELVALLETEKAMRDDYHRKYGGMTLADERAHKEEMDAATHRRWCVWETALAFPPRSGAAPRLPRAARRPWAARSAVRRDASGGPETPGRRQRFTAGQPRARRALRLPGFPLCLGRSAAFEQIHR
ncbi:MAG: hypothetical protein ACLQJR_05155 [Stellaceae bacterium]